MMTQTGYLFPVCMYLFTFFPVIDNNNPYLPITISRHYNLIGIRKFGGGGGIQELMIDHISYQQSMYVRKKKANRKKK